MTEALWLNSLFAKINHPELGRKTIIHELLINKNNLLFKRKKKAQQV